MSHNIQIHDSIVSTVKTWHGLETKVDVIDSLETAKLDWIVAEKALSFIHNGETVDAEGYKALVRQDKNLVLSVHKDSYAVIQNERIWEALHNSLNGIPFKIEVCGSLGNCKKIFLSASFEGATEYSVNGDKFLNNIIFCSSHDGSLSLEAYDSSIRVVCQNTLQWSRESKGKLNLKVKHTRNSELKIDNMEQEINGLFQRRAEYFENLAKLAEQSIKGRNLDDKQEWTKRLFTGFLAEDKVSTRTSNQVEKLQNLLYVDGIGIKGETRLDVLNAVTEFYTRYSSDVKSFSGLPNGKLEKQYSSSEFGSGADKKARFYNLMLSPAAIEKTVAKGKVLLEA